MFVFVVVVNVVFALSSPCLCLDPCLRLVFVVVVVVVVVVFVFVGVFVGVVALSSP